MATVTIGNREYDLDTLSEEAKKQLAALHFSDQEVNRLQMQLAAMQTAGATCARALNEEIAKQAPAFRPESLM